MDVDPDVAVSGHSRGSGMQAHPHRDRPRRERPLPHPGRGGGPSSGREGDEERIPLGIDLHTSLGDERVPQHATVIGQRLGIARRPELPQQARRPLDIREQERHRSPGKVMPHQRMCTAAQNDQAYPVDQDGAHLGECSGMSLELTRGRTAWASTAVQPRRARAGGRTQPGRSDLETLRRGRRRRTSTPRSLRSAPTSRYRRVPCSCR